MNNVEAYVQFTPDLISADGQVNSAWTADHLRNYMRAFYEFVARVLMVLPRPR
jgi:chromate reductase